MPVENIHSVTSMYPLDSKGSMGLLKNAFRDLPGRVSGGRLIVA